MQKILQVKSIINFKYISKPETNPIKRETIKAVIECKLINRIDIKIQIIRKNKPKPSMYFLTLLILLTLVCIIGNQSFIIYITTCLTSVTFLIWQIVMLINMRMSMGSPSCQFKHREKEKNSIKHAYCQLMTVLGNKLIQMPKFGYFVSSLFKHKSKIELCANHHSSNVCQSQQNNSAQSALKQCETASTTPLILPSQTQSYVDTNPDTQPPINSPTQQEQQFYEIRIRYINMLIVKQVRQFVLSALYAVCVGFVIGYRVNSLLGFVERFSLCCVVYLLPMILNSLWKLQRIYTYILYQHNLTTTTAPQAPSLNISINMSQQPYSGQQQNMQYIIQLIQLQTLTEILVILYLVIQCSIYVGCCCLAIGVDAATAIYCYGNAYYCGSSCVSCVGGVDVWGVLGWVRFGVNRMLVMLLGVLYVLIRDWYTAGKQYGTRKALWQVHQSIDKCLKLVSTSLRKMYHRQVYKAHKKLIKYKLIQPTNTTKQQTTSTNPYSFIYYQYL